MHTVGEYITEELDARGWTRLHLCRMTGRALSEIHSVIHGERPITDDMAGVLGMALGTSKQLWLNLAAAQKEAEALKQELEQLRAEQRSGPWRVGRKIPLNVYEGDRPMFQCHTPEDAARTVTLLNRAAELEKSGQKVVLKTGSDPRSYVLFDRDDALKVECSAEEALRKLEEGLD